MKRENLKGLMSGVLKSGVVKSLQMSVGITRWSKTILREVRRHICR